MGSRSLVGGTANAGTPPAEHGLERPAPRAELLEGEERSPAPAQQGRRHPHAARECRGFAPGARTPRSTPRCAAEPVPVVQQPQTEVPDATRRQALPRCRQTCSTQCLPPGEEDASGPSPCISTRDPPPRPWPSSVPVERCGAASRPGPQRRSAVSVRRSPFHLRAPTWSKPLF